MKKRVKGAPEEKRQWAFKEVRRRSSSCFSRDPPPLPFVMHLPLLLRLLRDLGARTRHAKSSLRTTPRLLRFFSRYSPHSLRRPPPRPRPRRWRGRLRGKAGRFRHTCMGTPSTVRLRSRRPRSLPAPSLATTRARTAPREEPSPPAAEPPAAARRTPAERREETAHETPLAEQ